MNEIKAFEFESRPIRIVTGADGEPRWVAKDVAEALGYAWNGTSAIKHVPEEWRGVRSVLTPSGDQEMAVLAEQGLYFFLGRSDKPAALPFQKWIAGEVLPSIRKTGEYRAQAPQQLALDLPDSPDSIRELGSLLIQLAGLREGAKRVEAKIAGIRAGDPPEPTAMHPAHGLQDRVMAFTVGRDQTSIGEVLAEAFPDVKRARPVEMSIAKALVSAGFRRVRVSRGKGRRWMYAR